MFPLRRVLVADDSPLVRGLLSKRVKDAGLDVLLCDSAATARVVRPTEIRGALLDLDLGDGNGTDVAATLRAARPDLPIAFFTASASGELIDRARTIGPVFVKPEELEDAVAWITGVLSGSPP